ncbi:MAG: ribonuclease Y [Desulfobia sp.]
MIYIQALFIIAILALGFLLGLYIRERFIESKEESYEEQGRRLIERALEESEKIKKEANLQAKDENLKIRKEADDEIKERKKAINLEERRLTQKSEQIDRKTELLDEREKELRNKEKNISIEEEENKERRKEIEDLIEQQRTQLEKIAEISREEAKQMLAESIESEARMEAAKKVVRIENEMKIKADKKAKNILALTIAKYAGDYVAEKTVSVVPLPSEEMKGRIIGREGRNIRAIEAATGIDVIIDDTPEAVILSGFNPIRREVARQSLERLVSDGRIHPARIEEIVNKANKELEASMQEAGEQATFDVGVHGVHPELIKLLGRLKYRTSYGQNVLQHSLEVAFLCGVMAAELGVNIKQAKRAGLLHDLGKAVDHEVEGAHASIGADLAKKYGESPEVVQALAAHHEDVPPESLLDILLQSADTLSGARPGARKEMLESYVKRLEELEKIAYSFKGVEKSYAIQAGREIRIVVNSSDISDAEATIMSQDIARQIEENLSYPGQIRVTVIRETRAVDYAK